MITFPKKRLIRFGIAAVVAMLLCTAVPPRAHAATITVTTAADEFNGGTPNGFCSLREAITNANTDSAAQADCTGGAGADTIIFVNTLDSIPIILSLTGAGENGNNTGDLDILGSLTISGNGAIQTIIDGGGIDRVFHLAAPAASAVTFENITIQNGVLTTGAGGGIFNEANGSVVIINNSLITNNTSVGNGAGIMNPTTRTINLTNSVVANNVSTGTGVTVGGGGIYNVGTLNVSFTVINNNAVNGGDGGGGGGIYNSGTTTITNSTISNNRGEGAITGGGGIANVNGTVTAVNSTISNNWSNGDGGGIRNLRTTDTTALNLTNVTITGNIADHDNINGENGGGVQQSGGFANATFTNTIIAGNDDFSGATQDDCNISGGTVTTNGYNVRYMGTGCDGVGVLNNVNDITSTPGTLGLGPLQENGGPTPTHNLLASSDAIDQVPTANCATTPTDQRGVTRADGIATGALCDVGAVEYVIPAVPSATTGGNGPGGVGVTDGSSNLELWLRADQGVFANVGCSTLATGGGNADCWQDQSGNGYHPTGATNQPTYQTGVVNAQPVLRFGGAHYLQKSYEAALNPSTLTIFGVWNFTSPSCPTTWCSPLTSRIFPSQGYTFYNTSSVWQFWVQNGAFTSVGTAPVVQNAWEMITAKYDGAQSTQYVRSALNAQAVAGYTPLSGTYSLRVGAGESGGGAISFFFLGDIAEEVIFSTALTDVQRNLVENYLSAKYNIDISASGNDHYDGDTPGNDDFDLDVAGIGQLGGNQHTQAYSVGMVVRNRSFLQDNGDWLLFGHHTAVNSNTPNNLPITGDWGSAPEPRRWDRHWFVDVTDAVGTAGGTVDIIFDFGEGGMGGQPPDGPVNNYRLLKRTLDSGDFMDIATATAVVGDQVQFLNVDVVQLGSNFTLGTLDFANSPTAVTMQNVTAVFNPTLPVLIVGMLLLLGLASLGAVLRKR